ncbi:DEAD/DEAH box helicase [Shigella flexneri]
MFYLLLDSNLNELGYLEMTPVRLLHTGDRAEKDVHVQAKTGSGKTATLGLGYSSDLMPRCFKQSLVLCPTESLQQVAGDPRR